MNIDIEMTCLEITDQIDCELIPSAVAVGHMGDLPSHEPHRSQTLIGITLDEKEQSELGHAEH